jgi:simple sugar transport system permease protein
LHLGFVVSLLAAVVVWWLLDRSTTGFAIRAVGANPHAAATAGMSVARTDGDHHGVGRRAGRPGRSPGGARPDGLRSSGPALGRHRRSIGFDAITVALLGRSKPFGIVLAGLLFGALHAGGLAMQSVAQTPLTLTTVLQALIVLFVAAPGLVQPDPAFVKVRRPTSARCLREVWHDHHHQPPAPSRGRDSASSRPRNAASASPPAS